MPSFIKFNQFIEDVYHGEHNFSTDTLKIAICPAATPPVVSNSVLAHLTTASLANATSDTIVRISSQQIGGLYSYVPDDLTFVASGGDVGPFQYVVIYNSSNNKLIGFSNYGSEITILETASFTIDFGSSLFSAS